MNATKADEEAKGEFWPALLALVGPHRALALDTARKRACLWRVQVLAQVKACLHLHCTCTWSGHQSPQQLRHATGAAGAAFLVWRLSGASNASSAPNLFSYPHQHQHQHQHQLRSRPPDPGATGYKTLEMVREHDKHTIDYYVQQQR